MKRYFKNNILVAFVAVICFMLQISAAYAQSTTIEGIVVDRSKSPVIGATIVEEGTNNATVSGYDGKFTLKVNTTAQINVEVRMLGYKTATVAVMSKALATIQLEDDSQLMDEVVVVGYGVMRRSDLTGSISQVKMGDEATDNPIVSADQFLQGRIAGVNISSTSGDAGSAMSVQIRGVSTITGDTQPLYVIDGFPIDGDSVGSGGSEGDTGSGGYTNPLALLNPSDIESIQVLKDASATAIYGSRATNGVILITTKQSDGTSFKATYNGRVDVSVPSSYYDVLDAYDYATYRNLIQSTKNGYDMYGNLILVEDNIDPTYTDEELEYFKTHTTDWQKEVYTTAISQTHNVSIAGGNKDTRYNISAGYLEQNGIIINTGMERFNFSSTLNTNLSKKMKLNTKVSYSHIKHNQASHSAESSTTSLVYKAISQRPTFESGDVLDENDEDAQEYGTLDVTDNPILCAEKTLDHTTQRYLTVNGNLIYQITNDFFVKVSGNLNSNSGNRLAYWPAEYTSLGTNWEGVAMSYAERKEIYNGEALLNYTKEINSKNRIDAMVGYTYEQKNNEVTSISVNNFADATLSYYSLESALYTKSKSSAYINQMMASGISRLNYSFDDRFLLTFTGRYDGSSLLEKENRWAFFPSGALAWKINNEKFMQQYKNISSIKLRLSYGVTGNQSVGYASTETIVSSNNVSINDVAEHGLAVSSLGNPDLKWEITNSMNAGIDFGFVQNRYRFSVDVYERKTRDMIINYEIPGSSGYTSISDNAGSITNRGIELEAAADVLTGKVKLSVGGNIYLNRNKVDDLNGEVMYGSTYLGSKLNQSIHITQEGYAIGSFYGYVVDGVYQNYAEASDAPYDASLSNGQATPGMLRYVDISGPSGVPDGTIDDYDKTNLGSSESLFDYGAHFDLSYAGFTLSALFTGRVGGKVANLNRYILDSFSSTDNNISKAAWDGQWTGEGTSNYYPAVDGSNAGLYFNSRFSNMFVEDGTFFKLKNVTLRYSHKLKNNAMIKSFNISASAANVFTVTNYTGYDPEVSITRSALSPNADYSSYPSSRTYSLAIGFDF